MCPIITAPVHTVERNIIPQLPHWLGNSTTVKPNLPSYNNIEYCARMYSMVHNYFERCRAHAVLTLSDPYVNTLFMYAPTNLIDTLRFRVTRVVRLPMITNYVTYRRLLNGRFFDQPTAARPTYHASYVDIQGYYDDDSHRPTTSYSQLESMIVDESRSDADNHINNFTRIMEVHKLMMRVSVSSKTNRITRGKDMFIGIYIPSKNILVVGDWSHSAVGVKYVDKYILDALVTRLNLKRLNHKIERRRLRHKIIITLGSDPEYEVIDRSTMSIVNARTVIHNMSGPIGLDGAQQQIELRPHASSDVDTAVNNLKVLVDTFYLRYSSRYALGVAGHSYPLGGHIHVGVGRTYTPPAGLLTMLDDFIGVPTVSLSGRARGHYKHLSQYESKGWGFEYRSAPAIIFMNPLITRIVYKIAKNITHKFVNLNKKISYNAPIGRQDLIETASLTETEADYYLQFCGDMLTRVGARNDMMPIEWGQHTELPPLLAQSGSTAQNPLNQIIDDDVEAAATVSVEPSRGMRFNVTFGDTWDEEISQYVSRHLTERFGANNNINLRYTFHRNVYIIMFGYRASRGFVSNLRLPVPQDDNDRLIEAVNVLEQQAVSMMEAMEIANNIAVAAERDEIFNLPRGREEDNPVVNLGSRLTLRVGLPAVIRQGLLNDNRKLVLDCVISHIERLMVEQRAVSITVSSSGNGMSRDDDEIVIRRRLRRR